MSRYLSRASVRAGLVQHEVDALAKFNISREQILARWWELANIDPAKGYNTSSQSRALELLWKGLGYVESEPGKPEEDNKPEARMYFAKWLREARGEVVEDEDGVNAGGGNTGHELKPSSPDLRHVRPASQGSHHRQ